MKIKKILCILLCIAQTSIFLQTNTVDAYAASQKQFFLVQAQGLALANSSDIKKQYNKILLKKMKYAEAVKGIHAKVKNLTSFRWSPLLSFKFPQQLKLTQEYDMNTKPLVLQAEITTLQHGLDDLRYKVLDDVNKAFSEVFILQEKTEFTEEKLVLAQEELSKNKAKLITGHATQNDVDTNEKSVKKLTSDLALQKRSFQTAKVKLKDLTKFDITSGYRFKNPLVDADIPRDYLEKITNFTLAGDQSFYESKMAEATALLNLNSYEALFRNQYGGSMNSINIFINQARQGIEVDNNAFKLTYDEMLKSLDRPWDGRYRILFFSFPKEWFKGEISGTRYIEDEMYAVYTACMEYSTARKDRESMEKSLRNEVASSFESLVTARNTYLSLKETLDSTRKELDKLVELNHVGKVEYLEVQDKLEFYQDLQLELLDALATYDGLLYDFDRLTCGAVTNFMKGKSLDLDAGKGGDSFVIEELSEKPYYYIHSQISDMLFVFGLTIPEGYEPEITDYEIWYEGTQIGLKTPIDETIRHLTLDYGDTSKLTVRLYNGDKFVDECEVETTVPRDVLKLKGNVPKAVEKPKKLGSYNIKTVAYDKLNTSVLSLEVEAGLGIKYYSIESSDGKKIFTQNLLPVTESFNYLTILVASLDTVSIKFYDKGKEEIYKGKFDISTQTIIEASQ